MATVQEPRITIGIEEILRCIPHRYPILLVDRIEDMVPGKTCRGIKNVTINEPFFQGHFPGRPVMPGVLVIEAMAQAGAVMLLSEPKSAGRLPYIGSIEKVKFKRPVVPGDTLVTEIEVLWFRNFCGCFRATGTVDGQVVAAMEMTFKLVERDP